MKMPSPPRRNRHGAARPERDLFQTWSFTIVLAGLDPAIHVDPRVKPAGDEK